MCTLIALNRCIPGASLVIAANRDEFLHRPSEGPALRESTGGAIVAPRDVRAGGTWLGMNAAGVFAAVTNRPTDAPNETARSRGLLVTDALESRSAAEAIDRMKLERLGRNAYNPFNLLVVDSARCFLATYGGRARVRELDPGTHVVGNADPFDARPAKLEAVEREVARVADSAPDEVVGGLCAVCASHGGNGDVFGDACVHAGAYGTRSSTILRVGESPADDLLLFADGAPCQTEYDDFTPLLHDLRHSSRYAAGATATRSIS